jgi:hypothetical protein
MRGFEGWVLLHPCALAPRCKIALIIELAMFDARADA